MRVLSPIGEKKLTGAKGELAPRLDTLSGKIIGFVDDGAGKAYFQRIEELLEEKVKPAQIIRKVKPILSRPASAEMLDEVAKVCNAVIAGLGM